MMTNTFEKCTTSGTEIRSFRASGPVLNPCSAKVHFGACHSQCFTRSRIIMACIVQSLVGMHT